MNTAYPNTAPFTETQESYFVFLDEISVYSQILLGKQIRPQRQ
ncbi:hypothetical protein ApDm4_0171 [Acetobacter pomorum]|nr:hypothetical protein ApDm4_0171 [Acetobacter pomorum]